MAPTNRATRRHPAGAPTTLARPAAPQSNGHRQAGGFDPADFGVEPLWYNFEDRPGRPTYTGPQRGQVDIPEPTGGQITKFVAALQRIITESQGNAAEPETVDPDGAAVAREFEKIDPATLQKFADSLGVAIAEITSGNPGLDEWNGLPFRAQFAMYGFIREGFLSPKSVSGDTSN